MAGAAIQWLRDGELLDNSADSEWMAQVEDTNGVCLVPHCWFGAPRGSCRGVIAGLTRGANKFHIVRAALESISDE